jgi:hypothetical protein
MATGRSRVSGGRQGPRYPRVGGLDMDFDITPAKCSLLSLFEGYHYHTSEPLLVIAALSRRNVKVHVQTIADLLLKLYISYGRWQG